MATYLGTPRLKSLSSKSSGDFYSSKHESKHHKHGRMDTHVLSCEQAPSERRVRHHSDTELPRCAQDVRLRGLYVEREERVFDLDRRDGMHGVCAADRRR